MFTNRTSRVFAAGAAALALALAGCSSDDAENAASTASSAASEATSAAESAVDDAASPIKAEGMYIKEMPKGKDMTAIFGTLKNESDKDITITDFTMPGLPKGYRYELHDVKDGVMYKVDGGLTIPANGELVLEPGSKHLMIMDATEPLLPGQEEEVVVNFDDGNSITFTAPVKVQAAGEENYAGDGELVNPDDQTNPHAGHGAEMNHGGTGHEGRNH